MSRLNSQKITDKGSKVQYIGVLKPKLTFHYNAGYGLLKWQNNTWLTLTPCRLHWHFHLTI